MKTHSTSASTKESKLLITFVNTKNTRTRQEISAEVSVWQIFWYNTAVWPISLETSSCRMVLNQDGSSGFSSVWDRDRTGCWYCIFTDDCRYSYVPLEAVHVVSCQDTDAIAPFEQVLMHPVRLIQPDSQFRQHLFVHERIWNMRMNWQECLNITWISLTDRLFVSQITVFW